ncbi:MAG: monooxygenase [Methyloligellaceae bacterium]
MYITVVEIDLPAHIDRKALKQAFHHTAPRYNRVAGLLRKYYCVSENENVTGGVFVWDSLENAKSGHSDPEWKQLIMDKYGAEARVTYFEVPVVVDNVTQKILGGSEYQNAMGFPATLSRAASAPLPIK